MLYAYGEDAMTLYALTEGLPRFLEHPQIMKDENPKRNQCDVFYRPSFGRKGGARYSSFGEFDAIIASKTHIYLIESKWQGPNPGKLKLEDRQKLRHDIFQWIYRSWNKWKKKNRKKWKNEKKWNEELKNGTIWRKFRDANEKTYKKRFEKPLPKQKNVLARNLQFVLEHLPADLKPINILLLFHEGKSKLKKVDCPPRKFRLVKFAIDNIFEKNSQSKIFKLKIGSKKDKKK